MLDERGPAGSAVRTAMALLGLAAAAWAGEAGADSVALLLSPRMPVPGRSLRVLAAGRVAVPNARVELTGPAGKIASSRLRSGGGPPYWWSAEFPVREEGDYKITMMAGGKTLAGSGFRARAAKPPALPSPAPPNVPGGWNGAWEDLYSAWIESLFSEADERASWKSLHDITRDASRNLLHDHLGLGEDSPAGGPAVIMEPDCADCPFFLRAYFAWKTGLPFGFHEADRGTLERAPRTGRWVTAASRPRRDNAIAGFNALLRNVMNAVHSGTARTRLDDDDSDYYPLALSRAALRPGAVFADPYGHTLVIARWIPQAGGKAGRLLSVDAQPDGTVGIKRFWEGNFLFETSGVIGEPGFKAFRPIVADGKPPRLLTNGEIAGHPGYGNLSTRQKGMAAPEFYDTLERLMNPKPLDPEAAFREQFEALHEQLMVRVESVANGEAYMKAHPGATIPMPGTAAGVFLSGGPWEDFSTPNRDLRVLIALDAVRGFPDKVIRSSGLYRLPKRRTAGEIRDGLVDLGSKWGRELSIAYTRTDGTAQILTVSDILDRAEALEMAYNPNDGIEIRWGAPPGSRELSSCRRRAPASQIEKMKAMRPWFKKRRHPPS